MSRGEGRRCSCSSKETRGFIKSLDKEEEVR